jgi:hypothetical protein
MAFSDVADEVEEELVVEVALVVVVAAVPSFSAVDEFETPSSVSSSSLPRGSVTVVVVAVDVVAAIEVEAVEVVEEVVEVLLFFDWSISASKSSRRLPTSTAGQFSSSLSSSKSKFLSFLTCWSDLASVGGDDGGGDVEALLFGDSDFVVVVVGGSGGDGEEVTLAVAVDATVKVVVSGIGNKSLAKDASSGFWCRPEMGPTAMNNKDRSSRR